MGYTIDGGTSYTTNIEQKILQLSLVFLDIIYRHKDVTLRNMCPVRPLKVNDLLKKHQGCGWYQDEISLDESSLIDPFQFVTGVHKKSKYPNMI